jgi:hypothetical protein
MPEQQLPEGKSAEARLSVCLRRETSHPQTVKLK